MKRIFPASPQVFSPRVFSDRRFALVLGLCAAFSLSIGPVSAQSVGYTGIFGGGPIYKSAASSIPELENSGFTEVIVWSVEVSSTGDLNFNGEFPLTSNGVYIGDQTRILISRRTWRSSSRARSTESRSASALPITAIGRTLRRLWIRRAQVQIASSTRILLR